MNYRILVVDDEELALAQLRQTLECLGHQVETCCHGVQAMALLQERRFDLVLTDLRIGSRNGMEILHQSKRLQPETEVVVIAHHTGIASVVEAMKAGAFYCVAKPLNLDAVSKVVSEALGKVRVRQKITDAPHTNPLLTQDQRMQELLETAGQIAAQDGPVLITGETGSGKNLLARTLHRQGPRHARPYIAIHCDAVSKAQLEQALAGEGSLFLNDITHLPRPLQTALLHHLQDQDKETGKLRILAADNGNLAQALESEHFLRELYAQLAEAQLALPPLRERTGDIALLAQHFLFRFAARMGKEVLGLSDDALALLNQYRFPGNVQELMNLIERGTALTRGHILTVQQLPPSLQQPSPRARPNGNTRLPTLEEQEKAYIQRVLAEVRGNQTAAAQILGINRSSLWRKLKAYAAPLEK